MPAPVLVDSSVFIRLLRQGKDPAQLLSLWSVHHDVVTCGVVRLEVLRGMRDPDLHLEMAAFFDSLISAPCTDIVWERATEQAWKMDRRGIIMSVTDLLIATCAQSMDAGIMTGDQQFASIPGLTVLDPAKELPDWS